MKLPIEDEFKGDNAHLCESIKALISLNDDGALVPHGIGGHARNMLAACYHRLGDEPTSALGMISGERARQVHRGFTAEHDDEHDTMELATAAWCYLEFYLSGPDAETPDHCPRWPWVDGWNPAIGEGSDFTLKNLVRAGALIAAEIERVQRLSENAPAVPRPTETPNPEQARP